MRPFVRSVVFGWLLLGPWSAAACADGGTMVVSQKKGGYSIAVFTAPTPFRAGPVDISVLVQDALTGEPLSETRVTLRLTRPGLRPLEVPATREAATNQLLRAAQFDLPEPGRWDLQVQVEAALGRAVIDCALEATEPLPRWRELWPWICWPAAAVALFGIYQAFARRTSVESGDG